MFEPGVWGRGLVVWGACGLVFLHLVDTDTLGVVGLARTDQDYATMSVVHVHCRVALVLFFGLGVYIVSLGQGAFGLVHAARLYFVRLEISDECCSNSKPTTYRLSAPESIEDRRYR